MNIEKESTTQSEIIIRRERTLDDGFYVPGKIENVNVMFATDTGASRTLISDEIYEKIPEDTRPGLVPAPPLKSADNSKIQEYGRALFSVEIGDKKLQQEIVVADISDEGLLGMDILQNVQVDQLTYYYHRE